MLFCSTVAPQCTLLNSKPTVSFFCKGLLIFRAAMVLLSASAQSPRADEFDPAVAPSYSQVGLTLVQPDGRIVVAGTFTNLDAQNRSFIGRLDADGTLDPAFHPQVSGSVYLLALQPDGKLLVGGRFDNINTQRRLGLARLNPDGTLDLSFAPALSGYPDSLLLDADGTILVGRPGDNPIVRLYPGGSVDPSFTLADTNYTSVMALQPDGKILVGGWMAPAGLASQGLYIGRLNRDGTLDHNFHPASANFGCSIALQADGKIVAGGPFTSLADQWTPYIGRLNSDGTPDQSFNPNAKPTLRALRSQDAYEPYVQSLAVQVDGKIVVGGVFSYLAGAACQNLARLNPDGSLDPTFASGIPEIYPQVNSIMLQPDGKILVSGRFSSLGGESRTNIGRLNNTDPTLQSLRYDGSKLTWLRAGTGPEVWRTTFAYSLGDATWTYLGSGTRVVGGWELAQPGLPKNAVFRARGFTQNGFVETVVHPPLQIENASANAMGVMNFELSAPVGQAVVVETSADLRQWRPIQTNVVSLGLVRFTDRSDPMAVQKFYRVRVRP